MKLKDKIKNAFNKTEIALQYLDNNIETLRRKHNRMTICVCALIAIEVVRLVAWIV